MFRLAVTRSTARTVLACSRPTFTPTQAFASQIWTAAKRPQRLGVIRPSALNRLESNLVDKINPKEEAKNAAKKLTPHPELVSSKSSVHSLQSEVGVKDPPRETEMLAGIKQDLVGGRSRIVTRVIS